MAFQLVYTSAPKLLQAGRTGFGTVARHPALKGTLQEEIERISQFSRVAGLDTHRTIYAHRILNIRGEAFNVISRIRDAGSDYTGRTNHIAHHIVVPSSEAKHDLSPVDLIIQLEHSGIWRNSWEDGPREFSADEEIKIAGFTKLIDLPATHWQPPKNAALPASGRYYESCWILHGGEMNNDGTPLILWMIGESLLLAQSPWNVSFSTDIQPTERVEELRWKGVCNTSPMRAVALQSVRPTIDLSDSAALPEPDGKLALMAEFGRDALPTNSSAIKTAIYGQEEQSTEDIKLPLIRKGGKRQSMQGDSLRFGNQTATMPKKSRSALNVLLIAIPIILFLAIGGFFYIRNSHTYDHLTALDTSIQEPSNVNGAIQAANEDWVYFFGKPTELTNAISEMTLYAAAVQLWDNKDYETALVKFKEASKGQNDTLTDKLRKISNDKGDELKILKTVDRIKSGTIQAALNPRADNKNSDITAIQYYNDTNHAVPGLSRDQVQVLMQLNALVSERDKSTLRAFKESLNDIRDNLRRTGELSTKIAGWLDEQACDYAINILKQQVLNSESLLQYVNADLIKTQPAKKNALVDLNNKVQLIKNGSKPDQDLTRQIIQESLTTLGVRIDECIGLKAIINELPKAEKVAQANIVQTKPAAERLVPTIIVPSLQQLLATIEKFTPGDDSVSVGGLDAWLKPANVKNAQVLILKDFSKAVKSSLPTGIGTVAWFHDANSTTAPEKGNWQTAKQIFLLPNESIIGSTPITIAVDQPLLTWDKGTLTLCFSPYGREIRDKLKTIDGNRFEYSVKRNGEPSEPIADSVALDLKRQTLKSHLAQLNEQLNTVYNQESIKKRYQDLYNSTNKFLNLGNLLTVNLTGSTDKDKKKKLDARIDSLKTFNDWLISEKGIKDTKKVDPSVDPLNGNLIGKYISSVFTLIEEEFCKEMLNHKLSTFISSGADPSKGIRDIMKILSDDDFKIKNDPSKYNNRDRFILNLEEVFKDSTNDINALSSMLSLRGDWIKAAARQNIQTDISSTEKQIRDLESLTSDDFQLSAERDGITITFTTLRQ